MTPRLTRRQLLVAGGLGLPLLLVREPLALLGRLPEPQQVARDLLEALPGLAKAPTNRLVVGGRPSFWAGVNYPWRTGQDFGTGGWGHSGVSDPTTYQEVDADFANMAAQGVRVVKWRVFSDGRYSPEFADDGTVTGLDELFFPDLDAALEIAERHDIYLVLTLFASGLWTADCDGDGVRLGGHAGTLLDPAKRRSLVEQGVVPLLRHLRGSDRVMAFEIIAEPEWGIEELHHEVDRRIKIPLTAARALVADVTRAIHTYAPGVLATVESNRASNMPAWRGLGLDFYSFSWYDWLEPYEPLATPASAFGLDRPVVLGEYPSGGSIYELARVLDLAYSLGYAGAFAWSYWSGDGFGTWRTVAPSFTDWVRDHWSDANPRRVAPPPTEEPNAEYAYPYTYRDLDVRLDDGAVVAEMKIAVSSGEPYVPHAYLYKMGSSQPLEDVRLTAARGQPGRLAARFTRIEPGTPYAISLAIFSRTGALRKWFNNVATFASIDGQIMTPKVDTLATELGCGG